MSVDWRLKSALRLIFVMNHLRQLLARSEANQGIIQLGKWGQQIDLINIRKLIGEEFFVDLR